jgi:hypothetical protein
MPPVRLAKAVRATLAVRALMAAALFCAALSVSATDGREATLGERVADIAAFGSRVEGSAGEAAVFEYVERALRTAGLEPLSSDFSDLRDGYSASRIVEARVRGARPDELAIIVPVSSWVNASEPSEGAYGIALALFEAARLSAGIRAGEPCPISLRFVFLGAEKRGKKADGETASLGSKTWIARQSGRARLAVLYLSMDAVPTRLAVRSAGEGVLSPYWYYEGVRRALEPSGIGSRLEPNRLQAYRLGLARDYGTAAPYLEAGIPAIELSGDSAAAIGTSAAAVGSSPDWFGTFVSLFMREERGGFADSWDRHYFIFQLGPLGAALRERTYVALLVIIFAIVASSFLVATVARRKAAKLLLRRVPRIAAEVLALFIALALVYLAGKGIARMDAAVLGSSDAWRLSPRIFAASRILFSFLLFLSLLSFLVEKRVLTPNPYFYEFAALVCLAVDLLVFSAVDLSASFYFMWALILVEISLATRRRWATLVAYVLMYVPLLAVASELAVRPDLSSYGRLIAPDYLGVLSLSALTFPFFVFTASPLLFYARPGAAARKRTIVLFAVCAFAVEALALAYVDASFPISGPGRRDLGVSELIDQDRGKIEFELAGLRRLGKGSLDRGEYRLTYDSKGDWAYLSGEDRGARISMDEKAEPFLDRMDESVAIRFETPPYRVEITLESAGEMLIYDCSLPYKVAVDGKSAVIYSGVNPGRELDLSMTVASSFRSRLVVTARYLASLEAYTQSSGAPLADAGLAIKASFNVGSGGR